MALDENHWRPDIKPPEKYRVDRSRDEILVFHAVGSPNDVASFGERTKYKGTPAVVRAVNELKAEGVPIRLLFTEAVPSADMRYLQVQADIIVDQLNFTRYGAFAREALMLGKPVVGRIDPREENGPPLQSMAECPIVPADLNTVKDVLRSLAADPARRRKLGQQSRAYALKWHSARALAERFERVYDHVIAGGVPADAGLFGEEATHH
jgi:glycosyltransferase involved in cell wall biosynthesis